MDETAGRGYATREDIRHLEDRIGKRFDNLEERIDNRIDKLDSRIDKLDNRLWLLLATVLASAVAVMFKGSA